MSIGKLELTKPFLKLYLQVDRAGREKWIFKEFLSESPDALFLKSYLFPDYVILKTVIVRSLDSAKARRALNFAEMMFVKQDL